MTRDGVEDAVVEAIWVDAGPGSGSRRLVFERDEPLAPSAWSHAEALQIHHLAKSFGPVAALRDINLHLRRGEVLGLLGDNASGKSTLLKVLAGVHRPDAGEIALGGVRVDIRSVGHARSLGIDCVYQDLALVDELSVWQNVSLGRELVHRGLPFVARRRMRALARDALSDVGVWLESVDVSVRHLSGGQRQAIAIARSMRCTPEILLLDEPIAAMGAKEAAAIMAVLERLRERSPVSIIFVAHNFAHVLTLCDRVNVIRDGCIALDKPVCETSVEELVLCLSGG